MDNKGLVRRYIGEVINLKHIAAVDELWQPGQLRECTLVL